ncbi:hypothetical protein BJ964_006740 [Actinoplanes lobatus]|uniref:Uncharacterized protein n=1 Tax=Actinoplanes lobatus TaxID=113568 RepID=A0A7W7HL83_9ACTN|nr:hypothetical protein [Actinoplanes lobatus]
MTYAADPGISGIGGAPHSGCYGAEVNSEVPAPTA